ncbi:MAG: ATP-binding protein [Nitrospirae bacterium]|nr:ATP-binding protein [Nitrospirota bacterium]MDA1305329.1 ATP-binding protein [Nitrospirota bacterium]
MGETRVDLLHLLEDLRDAYPEALEDTILTEVVANSLDSGASRLSFSVDASRSTLTVVDNGSGMHRRALSRYHDIASSSKVRGQGIGFAGVGIKLGLLICHEVMTETRCGKTHVATSWHLSSRHRAPWKWVPPVGLVAEQGTAVRLTVQNALSPLLDPGFVEGSIRRHFQPLLDPAFEHLFVSAYPKGFAIFVNGMSLEKEHGMDGEEAPLEIRLLRKRKPSAIGYLFRSTHPLPVEKQGLSISTLGKVIKGGWDWLGVIPTAPDRIGGLIEVPALAACLTLNKGDFVRVGNRGATFLAYRKAIQEAVSRQLIAWGDVRDASEEPRPRVLRPMERELERVLEDLSNAYPLLGSLIDRRAGGQKRLPLGTSGDGADGRALVTSLVTSHAEEDPVEVKENPGLSSPTFPSEGERSDSTNPPAPPTSDGMTLLPDKGGPRRPVRYGLDIQFEDRPDDEELGHLVESTVWLNQAHPAYQRAVVSRSVGYHIALTVALSLAPLAVEPAHEHAFVTKFLSRWGEEVDTPRSSKRKR